MRTSLTVGAFVCLTWIDLVASAASPGSLTVDEAIELSTRSGRPIFAVAGSNTCGPCRALFNRLDTDRSIQPLMAQFVSLKVDIHGEAWSKWSSNYPPSGNLIPLIYIVRADGEQIFGNSGSITGPALPALLTQQLALAGTIYSDEQLAQLADVTERARQALEKDDPSAAIGLLDAVRELGTPGNLGSFAAASRGADALFNQLVQQGKADLALAQEKIAEEETAFEGVLLLFRTEQEYGTLPELNAALDTAVREVRRNESMKTVAKQVDVFNQARQFAKSSRTKARAESWLNAIIAHFPDAQAADYARDELGRMQARAETATAFGRNQE